MAEGWNVYNGTIIGNWNDYNENGVQYNDTCEHIDDGVYDETEYIGIKVGTYSSILKALPRVLRWT